MMWVSGGFQPAAGDDTGGKHGEVIGKKHDQPAVRAKNSADLL